MSAYVGSSKNLKDLKDLKDWDVFLGGNLLRPSWNRRGNCCGSVPLGSSACEFDRSTAPLHPSGASKFWDPSHAGCAGHRKSMSLEYEPSLEVADPRH